MALIEVLTTAKVAVGPGSTVTPVVAPTAASEVDLPTDIRLLIPRSRRRVPIWTAQAAAYIGAREARLAPHKFGAGREGSRVISVDEPMTILGGAAAALVSGLVEARGDAWITPRLDEVAIADMSC
jgi:hypothetical protein